MLRALAKCFRRGASEISRFGSGRQGATAVEFALIAPPFLALLIAIFQTASWKGMQVSKRRLV